MHRLNANQQVKIVCINSKTFMYHLCASWQAIDINRPHVGTHRHCAFNQAIAWSEMPAGTWC